jgi:arylsulfatase A-like enzyme
MNRREFVQRSVAVSVAASLPMVNESESPARRMNVLYVFGDQHRECSMPGKPYSPIVAPAFEAFAKQNFVMENCISNYPLCTPYRAILMSGRWPQQTGVTRNGPDIALSESEHGLGQPFKDAGYHTAYVGKWHLYHGENHFVPPGPLRFGFDYWRVWGNTNKHYDDYTWDDETGMQETTPGWAPIPMTDRAIEFIGQQKKDKQDKQDKPWMMVVSWNPPHPPFNPPEEDSKPYPQDKIALRPNVALKRSDGSHPGHPQLQSESTLREAEQGYYGGITGVDKQFQRLLDALEATGQAANTIVIYTSDHGEMMGTHCRMQKQVPWEESCHVPFFIRIPGATNHGSSVKDLMGSIDIYPTLCGLAGIPVPKHCAGRDLSGVLRGEHAAASDGVILMNDSDGDVNDVAAIGYRGVRTLTHTYAVAVDGRWLLYDNLADPYQQKNLAMDAAQKPLMDKFDNMILAWQKTTGDKFPLMAASAKISRQPA